MRILAFSDLHLARARAADLVAASHDADLVIAAGDYCGARDGLDRAMAMLDGMAAPVLAVPGNGESEAELRAAAPAGWQVLHGQGVTVGGVRFFGLGYAHAQDRLWQMIVMRRTAQGRLSEIFGVRTVETDKLLRRLDLYTLAQDSVAVQDPRTVDVLES